jgi:hypothetical protein
MGLTHSPRIATDGLVFCLDAGNVRSYPGSGSSWKDLTNTQNDASISNATFNNSAFNFDGTNDYISTFDLSWNDTNSVTIEITLQPANLSQNRPFIGKGPNNWEWLMSQNNGTNLQLIHWDSGGSHTNGPNTTVSNFFTSLDTVHLTVVWNHQDNKFYIHKNSSLVATTNWVDASKNKNRPDGYKLGGNIYIWYYSGRYWEGKIYSHRVYNRALFPNEIKQNYLATKGRFNL